MLVSLQGSTEVKHFLHNHLRFTILYHKDAVTDLARIVGFEVQPFSVKHGYEAPWDAQNPILSTCNPARMVHVSHELPPQPVQEGAEVIFSYDVKFQVSNTVPHARRPGSVS
jgi:transmembrane 9 superfamily member 2/4